jgi:hypothetical protein
VDNKVRAIFFSPREEKSVRFLASVLSYKDNVAFGFVNTKLGMAGGLMSKYNVNNNRETLLMFNEESVSPVASISVSYSKCVN